MEDRRILIDTSVVIEYLRSLNRMNTILMRLLKKHDLCISAVSIFELYNGANNEAKKQEILSLENELEVIDFDIHTAKIASEIFRELRSKNKLIEFRDILIASSALQFDLSIATLNVKHFERIAQLKIFDLI